MSSSLPPDWPLSATFMWLDLRACQDSNGDGIGDLLGLVQRLDHFEEVGVNALVFPGLQPSDWAYAGTMMTGFCEIDPRFGTLADFDCLLAEAHARGIAIIPGWNPFFLTGGHLERVSGDQGKPYSEETCTSGLSMVS